MPYGLFLSDGRSKPSRHASLEGARALLERAGSCQYADGRGIDVVGPGHIGHRLARGEALDGQRP